MPARWALQATGPEKAAGWQLQAQTKRCTDASSDGVDCAETLFGRTFELICMSSETNSDKNKESYNNNKTATLNFRETKQK